jgi:hypothetical protein
VANKKSPNDRGVQVITLDTTGAVELMNAFGTSKIGSWRLQVVPGGADPGSFVLKQRMTGTNLSGSNWLTTIFYDDSTSTVQAAGTTVSTAKILTVIADRTDVQLDYTAGADGMTVYASPVNG